MSSLPNVLNSPATQANNRFWTDREAERKSGGYAAALTFCLLLAANAALLLPSSAEVAVPQGRLPLAVAIRRLPARAATPVAAEQPLPEKQRLLSESPAPDRLIVAKQPLPPVVKPVRPAPAPLRKAPRAEPRREVPPAPVTAVSASAPEAGSDTVAGSAGHVSGQPEIKPEQRGAILAALLHAVEAHKHYPRQARRAGIEGKALLEVTIGPDGRITACALAETSGKTLLDAATETLGTALLGLEMPLARGNSMRVRIPVRYALKR